MQTLINQGKLAVSLQDGAGKSANVSGTGKQIDAPLTHPGSLDVLARHLARLRPAYPKATQHHISNLIQQLKNYELNRDALRPAILRSIERIERHQ